MTKPEVLFTLLSSTADADNLFHQDSFGVVRKLCPDDVWRIVPQKAPLSLYESQAVGIVTGGWCLSCGTETAEEVELDAKRLPCAHCGTKQVHSLIECADMGMIDPRS